MLFHLLYPLSDRLAVFNVFRYLTFRTAVAVLTAFLLCSLLAPWFIRQLRRRSVGQSIRDVGPEAHHGKAGTPTMGGVLIIFAVVPFGPPSSATGGEQSWFITDINVGLLFVIALATIGVYGLILGGWASNSKFSLLGGLRSAAQMVSYEVSIGFVIITVLLCVGSLNMTDIVLAQKGEWGMLNWFWLPLFPMFVVFFISALAETNRPPFDLPEAERNWSRVTWWNIPPRPTCCSCSANMSPSC